MFVLGTSATRQGNSKAGTRQEKKEHTLTATDPPPVVTVGELTEPPDPRLHLRKRILEAAGRFDAFLVAARPGEPRRTGSVCWWELRHQLGGRVKVATFRPVLEELMAEGRLVEVWLDGPYGRQAPHALVLVEAVRFLRYPVAQARGRADVLPSLGIGGR